MNTLKFVLIGLYSVRTANRLINIMKGIFMKLIPAFTERKYAKNVGWM